MRNGIMMKWRVRRDSRCSSVEHEDIRRSLEVLDSVLAEFDDCLESWDSLPPLHNGGEPPISEFDRKLNEKGNIVLQANGSLHISQLSSENSPTDGGTSHNSWPSVQEQPKVHSPPPVPKRSLTTRLSDRNSAIFNFPSDDTSLDSYDSTRSVDSNEASTLSRPPLRQPISALSFKDDDDAGQNDDVFSLPKIPFESGNCANCGRELGGATVQMETSPFLQKKQMFEDKASPILTRSLNGSSFRIRKGMEHPSSCVNRSPESGFSGSDSSASPLQPPKVIKVAPPIVGVPSPPPSTPLHGPNCNCKERIRQLDLKFAETKKLLRSKKIKELEKPPPAFVPLPPPGVIARNIRNEIKNAPVEQKVQVPTDSLEVSLNTTSDSYQTAKNHDDSKDIPEDSESESFRTPPSSRTSDPQSYEPNSVAKNDEGCSEIPRLCNRCSRLVPALMSETIEDLPKLRPVDALNRPQLGLSCSMEDDLSPGVKEIIRTSTPKGDIKDMSSLSTFSLSASSLGYVSSQSDLELNNSLTEPEKVPVTSLRSQTLPIGLGLSPSPFYSPTDQSHQNNKVNKFYRDSNFNHTTRAEFESRSSSAPPLPEPEKPKKKHFRGFSRKDKKDKKKNGPNL